MNAQQKYKEKLRIHDIERFKKQFGTNSKFERAEFIAIDGEGETRGELEKFNIQDGKSYEAGEHFYTLLAASTGAYIYRNGDRLGSKECIDFLLDLALDNRRAIFVIFAGSYDINHILSFGFRCSILQRISRGETIDCEMEGTRYSIEYRARKSLSLKRGGKYDNNKKKWIWKDKITIWDVFGFFQESFIIVMKKWLGETHRHYELIKRMKQKRGDFANVDQKEINAYNQAELETLVELMQKVHGAVKGLDLSVTRWDGAGSIAAAMMKKHAIKEFKRPYKIDQQFETAICTAYAGGRIEICKLGHICDPIFDYDINSAYPSVMVDLPCLGHGYWKHSNRGIPPRGFTLVHIRYSFIHGLNFYPLFFRTEMMQILFPSEGEGWYWYPEYEAALNCMGQIDVLEWYHFEQECLHRPFSWIPEYYETRKKWVKNPDEEWQRGGEKIIKLGLNSLYGKTAQQLGGKNGVAPTYHQMEWAGFITSSTRARLYRVAETDREAIIAFATDGLFSRRILHTGLSKSQKVLGEWEEKQPRPSGLTIAMAGVYWLHNEIKGYDHFSRGFDKESMETPDRVLQAWERGLHEIDIPMHRLIGMGSACASDTMWRMRGRFVTGFRSLRLDGKSNKRKSIDVAKMQPYHRLIALEPAENVEFTCGYQEISHPYPIKWLEKQNNEEYKRDQEEQAENHDTENI